jgi:DhnA family fructose-bisphosphate aldolase class Ia
MSNNLRINRLFGNNGRALVVAMDHSRVFDTVTGLKDIEKVVSIVVEAGADSILTSYGSTNIISDKIKNCGIWLSVDSQPNNIKSVIESSLRLGVDGIKAEVYPWCLKEDEFLSKFSGNESIANTACLANECKKWNIPFMVESIPFGWPKAENRTKELVAAGARIASELGADYVKTFYTGDKESFRIVVENSLVPVLILGGPKIDSDLDILKMVRDAIDVGASGIAMGRNIWGHNNIAGMTAALSSIIHDDFSVENAQKYLK